MAASRLGLIANPLKPEAAETLARLERSFTRFGVPFFVESNSAELGGIRQGLPLHDLVEGIDLIVLLGGDGTILHLAKLLGSRVKPIAAINIGTLGFLTLGTADQLDEIAERFVTGRYRISRRSVIRMRTFRGDVLTGECHALNEVSFNRGPITRLVKVELRVDGEFVTLYGSDGLIVATPTGSTAYSLSAGGPIIEPEAGVFVVTPVCPHSLSSRPLVLADRCQLDVSVPVQRDEVFVTVDGQDSRPVHPEERFEIQRAAYQVPLVTSTDSSFFEVLRQKLDWSGSKH